jgi:small GTP-binding protein
MTVAMSKQTNKQCVLLGQASVGKSSLIERFLHQRYLGTTQPTVGAAFGSTVVTVANTKVQLCIWDTAGSERFQSMTKHYFQGAEAAVICHDLCDDGQSFEQAKYWVKELLDVEEDCIIVIVGTKHDLLDEKQQKKRAIPPEVVKHYARTIHATEYETSALTGKNVDAPFHAIAEDFLKKPAAPITSYSPAIKLRSSQQATMSGSNGSGSSSSGGKGGCC